MKIVNFLTSSSKGYSTNSVDTYDDVLKKAENSKILYDSADLAKMFKVPRSTFLMWDMANLMNLISYKNEVYITHDDLMEFVDENELRRYGRD